ncbi:MAG: hypothetical protein ACO3CS_11830, partial [Alphaproteobacteria bacterium]
MRRRDVIFTGLAGTALAACASPSPPEPLAQLADGRLLVVAPAAAVVPARPPPGGARHGARAARLHLSPAAGRSGLRVDAPGGDTILRRIDGGLVSTPILHWHWKLEPSALDGAGDGLPRGLRIIVGLDGGGS